MLTVTYTIVPVLVSAGHGLWVVQRASGQGPRADKIVQKPDCSACSCSPSRRAPLFSIGCSLRRFAELRSFAQTGRPGLRVSLCGLLMVLAGENFALCSEPVLILVAGGASPL